GEYYAKYARTGAMEHLESEIRLYENGLSKTPRDSNDWLSLSDGLGDGYYHQYTRTRSTLYLEKAIQRYQESLDKPCHPPDPKSHLTELRAKYLDTRAVPALDHTHLDRALHLYRESIANTPENHPDRMPRVGNLAVGFHVKYVATREAAYLDRATEMLRQCLDMTPKDHPDRRLRLYQLAATYQARYQETGSVGDINTEIRYLGQCRDIISNDTSHQSSCLCALGMAHYRRYQELNKKTDLDTAIGLFQESLQAMSLGHPDRASRLYDLGAGYHDLYNATSNEIDLDKAIQLYEESIESSPACLHDQASRISSLGTAYRVRYLKKDSIKDLDKSIYLFEKFLDQTPKDHPSRATRLNDLAVVYIDRHQESSIGSDRDKAILLLREALNHAPSPTPDRLVAAKVLFYLHTELEAWGEAHRLAQIAVHLLPSVVPRLLGAVHKQSILSQDAGLASDAAAIAFTAKRCAFDALQLLEIGRGVISGLFYELAADVAKLHAIHPALSESFIRLKKQLEAPSTSGLTQTMQNDIQLDKLIVQIRTQPGLENFLLASSEEEMRAASRFGPIVAINVSDFRCDAILVEQHQIRSLYLPLLNMSEIQLKTETAALDSPKTLEWLWDVIANPVLEALGYTQSPSNGHWPHVWWVPTGPLSRFPVHAAGYHYRQSCESVLDRVMSSYSSSIKAIISGRQRPQHSVSGQALLLAMEHTPGSSPLPFASQEIAVLRDLMQSMAVEPTVLGHRKSDVMLLLRDCSVFHFAGHGHIDREKPSNSRLILEDGPLTVGELMEMKLQSRPPFLAYLSACGTGQIKNDKFMDEGIHLISAFQMAGFRHVIGTLWEVDDGYCVDIARHTYEGMRDQGMTDESVCHGLHMATRALRDRWLGLSAGPNQISPVTDLDRGLVLDEAEIGGKSWRDIVACVDEEVQRALWVPYVHFGV
ncbi:CHAT domain-containing protein, partial [Fusarium flagelliforme]|uniref:CHAT domain-containing protein n=1 Tax=Fusarium flagelliforme TaxID=2675880 RepID=UPI001E8D961E